jgi:hypothetical protein
MEHKDKTVMAEAIQRSSQLYRVSICKLILLSREPAVLAYHLGELTVSAYPGNLRRQLGGRGSPVVRNLPKLFIEVTCLGASSSGIQPQGASGSSKPVDEGDLQYAAFKVGGSHTKEFSNTEPPSESRFLSAGSHQFWHTTLGS